MGKKTVDVTLYCIIKRHVKNPAIDERERITV